MLSYVMERIDATPRTRWRDVANTPIPYALKVMEEVSAPGGRADNKKLTKNAADLLASQACDVLENVYLNKYCCFKTVSWLVAEMFTIVLSFVHPVHDT